MVKSAEDRVVPRRDDRVMVEPHTADPIEMHADPAMMKKPMSAADEARRKELMERGPQNEQEHEELARLNEMGDVPPELTAEGCARLKQLQDKGPLPAEDQAKLKRLEAKHADQRFPFSMAEQHELDDLHARGPRTEDEEHEMQLLQKAVEDRRHYEEEKRAMEEKAAAGPFSVEQWRHLTSYMERAIQNRHRYQGRVPA